MSLLAGVLMNVVIWVAALSVSYGIYRLIHRLRGGQPVEHTFTSLEKGPHAPAEVARPPQAKARLAAVDAVEA